MPRTDDSSDPPTTDSTAPAARQRRPRRQIVLPIVLVGVAVLLVGGLTLVAGYAFRLDSAVEENLQRIDELPPEVPAEPGQAARPTKDPKSRSLNYVLIGSDSRAAGEAGAGRSDALMVLHLSGDRRSAHLISFPRDLYVSIPGHGKNKINAAYAFGGTTLTVRTLEGLLGVRMDHVAVIDFAGFVGLTEELGGVTVYNEHPSVTEGWTFPRGYVTVRGAQALAYVRERKQLPRGDLDRAERQRAVVSAIIGKALSREVVADPDRFVSFAAGAARHISVDRQLTQRELRRTAASLRLTPDDIGSVQAPIRGFGTTRSGQSIDLVDQTRLTELAAALQQDLLADYVARYPNG